MYAVGLTSRSGLSVRRLSRQGFYELSAAWPLLRVPRKTGARLRENTREQSTGVHVES